MHTAYDSPAAQQAMDGLIAVVQRNLRKLEGFAVPQDMSRLPTDDGTLVFASGTTRDDKLVSAAYLLPHDAPAAATTRGAINDAVASLRALDPQTARPGLTITDLVP